MGQPAILFPDTATLVIDGILAGFEAELITIPVVSKVPTKRPDEFLTVRRLGGPRRDLVTDTAQLAVEAYALTETAAHDYLQIARALIAAMAGTVVNGYQIYKVTEIAGPHEFPDPISESPRYAYSPLVATRGVALNP